MKELHCSQFLKLLEIMIKIQSMSDIITNSSSEVFIIDSDQNDKIITFIKDVCDICGWNADDIMNFKTANCDGHIPYWDIPYKEGNLIIRSRDDNSIPYIIMELISDLRWMNPPTLDSVEIKQVERRYLG